VSPEANKGNSVTNILLITADDMDGKTTNLAENPDLAPVLTRKGNSLSRWMTGTGDPRTSQFRSAIGQAIEFTGAPTA
jgi:hypothetical protein